MDDALVKHQSGVNGPAVWGPHEASEAASQPGLHLSRRHCSTSVSHVRDIGSPEVPACPRPLSALPHLPAGQPNPFISICVFFLLEITKRLKGTLGFCFF